MHQRKPDPTDQHDNAAQWLSLGLEFAGVLAIFSYGGYRLDEAWKTEPWCLLGGFFIALSGMLYLTFKRAIRDQSRKQ
jgi:drug/metabolite transporter (DMT)-like permease